MTKLKEKSEKIRICKEKKQIGDYHTLASTIIGFDKRFIALPIRNKGIGAIVTAKQ